MDLFLHAQQHAVAEAQVKNKAANAIERHINLNVKQDIKHLLISPKGLGTSFALGAVKGVTSTKRPSITKFLPIFAKMALA